MVTRDGREACADESAVRKCVRLMGTPVQLPWGCCPNTTAGEYTLLDTQPAKRGYEAGGRKYCFPLTGSVTRLSSCSRSWVLFTKSISDVSTISRSLAV